ncbi:MAG: hypothetical protein NZ821_09715, partial [Gloeomargarita sp. SKYB31]|nr:hypothetical protein [Gloeomargarita sp. SKYB31]
MEILLLPLLLGLVVAVPAFYPATLPDPPFAAQLNLSTAQRNRLQDIQTTAHHHALRLLTPDQQAQWTPDSLWQNTSHLDLTPEQRRQLAALRLRTL